MKIQKKYRNRKTGKLKNPEKTGNLTACYCQPWFSRITVNPVFSYMIQLSFSFVQWLMVPRAYRQPWFSRITMNPGFYRHSLVNECYCPRAYSQPWFSRITMKMRITHSGPTHCPIWWYCFSSIYFWLIKRSIVLYNFQLHFMVKLA